MQNPPALKELTKPNLAKKLSDIFAVRSLRTRVFSLTHPQSGTTLDITDPTLNATAINVEVYFV